MQVIVVLCAAGALQLHVEVTAKPGTKILCGSLGPLRGASQKAASKHTVAPAGQRNKPVSRLFVQPARVQEGLAALLAFQPRAGQESGEVAIAGQVPTQENQSRWLLAVRGALVSSARVPDLGTHDRLDAGRQGGAIELHQAKQIALISYSHGRHAGCGCGRNEFRHAHNTVCQRVFGMHVQVHEACRLSGFGW